MATLINIESNSVQQFEIGNYKFNCKAYGVIGIEELYDNKMLNTTCKASILKFYKKRADLKYYVESKLNIEQLYRIKFRDNRCLISTSGEKSLSEFLLEEGLAVRKPLLKDREYEHYFYKSELNAKMLKKGIWKENITRECVAGIYNQ